MFWGLEGEWTDGLSIISALGLMLSWVRNGAVATLVVHKRDIFEDTEIWFSNTGTEIAHNFALDLWVLERFFTEIQQALCLQTQETNKTKDFIVVFFSYVLQWNSRWLRWSAYLSWGSVFKPNFFSYPEYTRANGPKEYTGQNDFTPKYINSFQDMW